MQVQVPVQSNAGGAASGGAARREFWRKSPPLPELLYAARNRFGPYAKELEPAERFWRRDVPWSHELVIREHYDTRSSGQLVHHDPAQWSIVGTSSNQWFNDLLHDGFLGVTTRRVWSNRREFDLAATCNPRLTIAEAAAATRVVHLSIDISPETALDADSLQQALSLRFAPRVLHRTIVQDVLLNLPAQVLLRAGALTLSMPREDRDGKVRLVLGPTAGGAQARYVIRSGVVQRNESTGEGETFSASQHSGTEARAHVLLLERE